MKRVISLFIFLMIFYHILFAQIEIPSNYIVRTFIDKKGILIDEILVPGIPPNDHREPTVELPAPNSSESINILSDVPTFNWSFGCSATSAAMIAGYYDRTGYGNIYNGPTNSGVMPMDNTIWPDVIINGETRHQCPLSATHQGLDGRTTFGHVDDYWHSYGSNIDPYYGNWTEHTYGECTADYMGTNQYHNWQNTDGSTRFYYSNNGTPLYDYTGCEPTKKDGCHGFREFIESRGYSFQYNGNYSQYIYGYNGLTNGFTYNQFKNEIDAGRPVIIQVEGHSMVGFGYDDSSNLIYIHDTWDHSNHTMTWGGSYSGMQHYGVGVFILETNPVQLPDLTVSDIWTVPSTPTQGENCTLYAKVINIGNVYCSNTLLEWYWSSNTLTSTSVDGLNPNQEISVYSNFTFNESGTSSFEACIDPYDVITESNETNNCIQETLSVSSVSYYISGNIGYFNNNNPVPNANINLTGTGYFSELTNSNGDYTFSNIPGGNYSLEPNKYDDLGGLSGTDASRIARYTVGLYSFNYDEMIAADVTMNGTISGTDASRVARYSVNLINYLNDYYIDWIFISEWIDPWNWPPIIYQSIYEYNPLDEDKYDQDFTAIRLGDVSGNWSPSTLKGDTLKIITEFTVNEDTSLLLPIQLNSTNEIEGVDI